MTATRQQFLELLKAGLWGERADGSLFKEGADWRKILKTARQQTVQAVILYGIETLPEEAWPPKEVIHRLMMDRTRNVQMHRLLNSTLNDVVQTLDSAGIPSVLLKGQGVAQNYAKPESRSCGDIDLYVGECNFTRAIEVISGMKNDSLKVGVECDHHVQISLNQVEIELHKKADYMPGTRMNRDLQQWTIESIDSNFGTGSLPSWDNAGTKVSLAPATFDAFFILHHAVRHMTTGGIGFRQLCDWTMYLHRNHAHIDAEALKNKLERYHMTAIWQEFGILAVRHLGLPIEELPLAPASTDSSKTGKILDQIFISGNFGHADTNHKEKKEEGYMKRKWRDFSYQSSRLMMLFSIFPSYSFRYFLRWANGGVCRLLSHK
jgi:hypothetical protein